MWLPYVWLQYVGTFWFTSLAYQSFYSGKVSLTTCTGAIELSESYPQKGKTRWRWVMWFIWIKTDWGVESKENFLKFTISPIYIYLGHFRVTVDMMPLFCHVCLIDLDGWRWAGKPPLEETASQASTEAGVQRFCTWFPLGKDMWKEGWEWNLGTNQRGCQNLCEEWNNIKAWGKNYSQSHIPPRE